MPQRGVLKKAKILDGEKGKSAKRSQFPAAVKMAKDRQEGERKRDDGGSA